MGASRLLYHDVSRAVHQTAAALTYDTFNMLEFQSPATLTRRFSHEGDERMSDLPQFLGFTLVTPPIMATFPDTSDFDSFIKNQVEHPSEISLPDACPVCLEGFNAASNVKAQMSPEEQTLSLLSALPFDISSS